MEDERGVAQCSGVPIASVLIANFTLILALELLSVTSRISVGDCSHAV